VFSEALEDENGFVQTIDTCHSKVQTLKGIQPIQDLVRFD